MKYECESRCFNYPIKCYECKVTSDIYNHNPCFLDRNSDLVKQIKAEAIKEFLRKQEIELANNTDISAVGYQSVIELNIKILKEMGIE